MDRNIIISLKTIFLTLAVIMAGYIIYRLGPVLAIIFLSGIIVLALEPMVEFFKGKKVFNAVLSRSTAVIITYALFLSFLMIVLTVGFPPVVSQAQKLIVSLPSLINQIPLPSDQTLRLDNLIPQLSNVTSNIFQAVSSGFSFLASAFSIIMFAIYMSLDWENLKRRLVGLFPDKNKLEVLRIVEDVEKNIGQWVKAQLFLMILIGTLTAIVLLVLQIPYALALGLIAGLLEVVPILGPVITGFIMSIIVFAESPVKGLLALGLFILIQQLESNILVPKVMQKFSGFSPLVTLLALLVGSTFFGVFGAILAVPMTMILVIVAKAVLKHTNDNPSVKS